MMSIISTLFLFILHSTIGLVSVRDIMIKRHFLVTLVVSTGHSVITMYRLLIPHIKPSVDEIMIKSHWANAASWRPNNIRLVAVLQRAESENKRRLGIVVIILLSDHWLY